MNVDEIHAYLAEQRYAVEASVSAAGAPQAAVVGIVVSERWEVFFDTLESTRKMTNLRRDPRIALVIGWDERTVQLEGLADEPQGADLERLFALYLSRFPDGRERQSWPGITCVRVRPTWLRMSDFSTNPPTIVELAGDALQI